MKGTFMNEDENCKEKEKRRSSFHGFFVLIGRVRRIRSCSSIKMNSKGEASRVSRECLVQK